MRCLLFLWALLFSINAKSQQRNFYGRVLDADSKQGIPNAIIEVKDQFTGIYCDSKGRFSFDGNSDSIKIFSFYSLGYIRQEIPAKDLLKDSIIIMLKKGYNELDDFTVKEQGTKHKQIKERILGKRKLNYNGGCYMVTGDEVAIYLDADPDRHGVLKEVFVYVTGEGFPGSRFRLRIYEKDSGTIFPGQDITDSVVIAHADKGNEWVNIDFSNKKIPLKDGIFVSVEWIEGYGNEETTWTQKKLSEYYFSGNGYDNDFNGQVLGLTWSYGIQSITCISYHNDHGIWSYADRAVAGKHSFLSNGHWINPMIYCTDTYSKK